MINIGTRREPLWDYFLVDEESTTATLSVNQPSMLGPVFDFDAPWEGNACVYPVIIRDGDRYCMYYGGRNWPRFNPERGKLDESKIVVCKLESYDGINWWRTAVDRYTVNECTKNNVVLSHPSEPRSCLSVFIDENPECPPEQRYKGIDRHEDGCKSFQDGGTLAAYASADGTYFERIDDIAREGGKFDSLNTVMYNKDEGQYRIYYRDFMDGKRAVACKTSKDFRSWENKGFIEFDDSEVFQLYTNNIRQYPRAPHVYIGFPVRYVERTEWTENYDQLPDREARLGRMHNEAYKRLGLALTDSLFMCSRDGMHFKKFNEAFVDSGMERSGTWKYGNNYLSHGYTEDEENIYLYEIAEEIREGKPSRLIRYSIRQDGFASFKAPYSGARIVTKPFSFKGDGLSVNFRTSAAGWIRIRITDKDGRAAESMEIFGNHIDRRVAFDKPISDFSDREVTMLIEMRDAEIYSFRFFAAESDE